MRPERVVVTGVGVICAAGRDTNEFWRTILSGQTALRPSKRPGLARYGRAITGEVPDDWISEFAGLDAEAGYDRDVLLAVIAARQALRQARLDPLPALWQERTGLVLGKCQAITPDGPRSHGWIHSTADDIAHILGASGPRQTVATACSAGSNAVGLGRDRLLANDADIVLAGGVDVLQDTTYTGFHALQSLDSEPCSPYSRSAGLSLGEGSAFLVLEPHELAVKRGAPILAEVMGYGLSADAYHPTAPDPTGRGAALAVKRALADSSLDESLVTYVNGHGTGTTANDTAERRIMRGVFGSRPVPLTSTKSFVGHTLGAAGAIEAVTSVLSIMHGIIPPTVNFGEPRSGDLDFVPNKCRPADIDVVVSNSYAFGGNNASLVLGRARVRPAAASKAAVRKAHEEAVITGVGLVGRPGIGLAAWAEQLAHSDTRTSATRADDETMLSLAGQPFATPSLWRHMNGFTRLCMAASRLAVDDAGLPLTRQHRDGIGLVLGTMSGAAEVRASLKRQDGDGARRIHEFTQMTLNTPAGAVCQALAIRGLTTTITSGGASGTLALETALDAIRLGRAEAVVVVAAEQACPDTEDIYRCIGALGAGDRAHPYDRARPGTSCGTAAVALVLEAATFAIQRRARLRGRVAAVAHASDNYHPYRFDPSGKGFAAAMRRALRRASLPAPTIDLVAGSATGTDLDTCEEAALRAVFAPRTPVIALKAVTGECEAASGLVNVALPLLLDNAPLGNSVAIPAGSAYDDPAARVPAQLRRVLATSVSFGGTYGAVVLEKESL